MFSRKLKLPTTHDEFDKLVTKLVKKYKFNDPHHTAAILTVAIRHLPTTQAYASLDYFGQYILKNLANFIANHKSQTLQQEAQIDQLVNILKNDPLDAEARDKIQLAANEGSSYAKTAMAKFETIENPLLSQSAN